MPDDLYDRDALIWSERQAELLRRLSNGERVNEAIDWPHVIEEIEDVGRSQLTGCESLLRQAMVHLIKLRLGEDRSVAHWRAEIASFLADAQARFAPSMRQRIEVQVLYVKAIRQLRGGSADLALERLPAMCPVTLDDLLDETINVAALEARFAISA